MLAVTGTTGFSGYHAGLDKVDLLAPPQPEPLMTAERARRIVTAEDPGPDLYRAMGYIAGDACLHQPHALDDMQQVVRTALRCHFEPRPSMPTPQVAFERVILTGTMGCNYWLFAHGALVRARRSSSPPRLGPPDYYVVENAKVKGGAPRVGAYPVGSPKDLLLRMTVLQMVEASQQIAEPGIYERYEPVWRLEQDTRESLTEVRHPRSTQIANNGVPSHPLDVDRVRIAAAQFGQNVTLGLCLLKDAVAPATIAEFKSAVRCSIRALEIASQHPLVDQRTCMGDPGTQYEHRRWQRGIIPHMVSWGNGELRIAGLENTPTNLDPTACAGQNAYQPPSGLDGACQSIYEPISPIGLLAYLLMENAKYTICRELPLRRPLY